MAQNWRLQYRDENLEAAFRWFFNRWSAAVDYVVFGQASFPRQTFNAL
jgi:hypothetical protein